MPVAVPEDHIETPEERAARKAAKKAKKAEKAEKKAKKAEKAEKGDAAKKRRHSSSSESSSDSEDAEEKKKTKEDEKKSKEDKKSKKSSELSDNPAPTKKGKSEAADDEDSSSASAPAPAKSAAEYLKEHNVKASAPPGFQIPAPMDQFSLTPFSQKVLTNFTTAGYSAPTVTQALAWPLVLTGANVVFVAKTGSGKTLGFLMPTAHLLQTGPALSIAQKPAILVVAPTRELACQIEVEASKFTSPLGLRSTVIYGGAPKGPQIRFLQRGCDIVIGTPGRIRDMVEMQVLSLKHVKFLILDEADRMLDMGFEEPMRAIVELCPKERQTLLFTATWPKEVQRLAEEFCPKSVMLSLGDTNVLSANQNIKQSVELLYGFDKKLERLTELFKTLHSDGTKVKEDHGKTIVFVKLKSNCQRIAQALWDLGFFVNTLHGDMEQWERTQVINDFRASKLRVLVATDVAARGLDVKDVTDVVNFDFPAGRNGVEDYVHRIGRTARAGATGSSYTFFDPRDDAKNVAGLIAVMRNAKQAVPEELSMLQRNKGRVGGGANSGAGGRGRGGFGGGRGRGGRRW